MDSSYFLAALSSRSTPRLRSCLLFPIRDLTCWSLRKSSLEPEFFGDLSDLLRRIVGREDSRLRRQVVRWHPLRRFVYNGEFLSGLGMRAVEDGAELQVVGRREAIEPKVVSTFDVGLAVGDPVGRNARCRKHLH